MKLRVLWLYCGIGASGLAAVSDRYIAVSPNCQPLLSATLATSGEPEPFSRLSIRHRMLNNGVSFRSELFVGELSSYALKLNGRQLKWSRLNGDVHVLNTDGPNQLADGCWSVLFLGDQLHITHESGKDRYVYEHCRLQSVRLAGKDFVVERNAKHCSLVELTSGSRREVCAWDYDRLERIGEILFGRERFACEYNDDGQLIKCVTPGTNLAVFTARYENGLLQSATGIGFGSITYAWTSSKWLEYANPPAPLEPVVESDTYYRYKTYRDTRQLRVEVQEKESGRRGGWILPFSPGQPIDITGRRPRAGGWSSSNPP